MVDVSNHKRTLQSLQGNKCFYCIKGLNNTSEPGTIDHIVPISKKGSNAFVNKVLSCKTCNNTKGSRKLDNSLIVTQMEFFNGVGEAYPFNFNKQAEQSASANKRTKARRRRRQRSKQWVGKLLELDPIREVKKSCLIYELE